MRLKSTYRPVKDHNGGLGLIQMRNALVTVGTKRVILKLCEIVQRIHIQLAHTPKGFEVFPIAEPQ
jgi:hypothetical protein